MDYFDYILGEHRMFTYDDATPAIEQRDKRIAALEAKTSMLTRECDDANRARRDIEGDLLRATARIAELEAERDALMRKYAIESDESLTECVDRNIDGWKQRCWRSEEALTDQILTLRAERDALKAALDRIAHHGPPMLARGEYRQGALDALESVRKIANAALAAKGE